MPILEPELRATCERPLEHTIVRPPNVAVSLLPLSSLLVSLPGLRTAGSAETSLLSTGPLARSPPFPLRACANRRVAYEVPTGDTKAVQSPGGLPAVGSHFLIGTPS